MFYCAICTYFAMFRMKLCDFYALHPHRHSDASSLLFNATYACRLGPPLCFNFLKLLHAPDALFPAEKLPEGVRVTTYFTQTSFGNMGQISGLKIPLFSNDYFDNFAPLVIVFLCGCTYLDLGSGLLSCCGRCLPCMRIPSFSFDEDFSDSRIDHGAQIL